MIYCVRHADVLAHLTTIGFRFLGSTDEADTFRREGVIVVVRKPNVHGHLPEILVNDAFETSGLTPPRWDVFWSDEGEGRRPP